MNHAPREHIEIYGTTLWLSTMSFYSDTHVGVDIDEKNAFSVMNTVNIHLIITQK